MLLLKDILNKSIQRSGIGRQLEANQVLSATVAVVEEWLSDIANSPAHCHGEYFKQGTVFVTVPSGILAQELRFKEHDVLERVNAKLGSVVVKRLHLFVGAVESRSKKR